MRRARLKVQATVPIRRKALQEVTKADADKPPISNPVVDVEKPPSETPEYENVEQFPEKITETQKSTKVEQIEERKTESPVTIIDSEIKVHNLKQEIIKNHVPNESTNIDKETNNSIKSDHSNIVENNKEPDLQTSTNNELDVQVNVENSQDDNTGGNQPEKETQETPSPVAEVNPPKQIANRSCFMRPVPRLDSGGRVRKNSMQGSGASASESEDELRKSAPARVRNDSICSVQSNKDTPSNAHSVSKIKVGHQKRRLTVSESARKLAEARKEFMLKHENKTPDRSKLTMYDLIYYNPVTNPMTRSENAAAARKISVSSNAVEEQPEVEEEEDEPTPMPVPQVKVGPDGQLIVDEKSLIIERTEQKNRSGPIVHDESNGGGFYKRRQKSKDWSKWDTLRFYKALSNIGTDFLLMQNFFPKRTRQELKLKFKKEERMNRALVEQALKCQVFDLEQLKEEMEVLAEEEKKETEALKMKTEVAKKQQQKSRRPTKCRFVIGSIEEMENSGDEDVDGDLSSEEVENGESQKKLKKSTKRRRKPANPSIIINDVPNESSSDTEDMEIYNVKPTRSGRLPKRRKLQAPSMRCSDSSNSDDEPVAQDSQLSVSTESPRVASQPQDIIANMIPNIKDVEPGSLVILTRESPGEPGKTVVQVYMVSKNYNANDPNSEQNMTPLNLSPELLATVNSKISETEPIHVKSHINPTE